MKGGGGMVWSEKCVFSARLFQKTLGYRADGKDDARFSACLSGRARFNPNAPAFVPGGQSARDDKVQPAERLQ